MDDIKKMEQLRKALEAFALTAEDGQAANFPTLYPVWRVGEVLNAEDRRYYPKTERLYKALQGHTTQADWPPDKTPALWSVIDVTHSGTLDDPIPAERGMEYIYGVHYSDPEDTKVYCCSRSSEADGGKIVLHFLPHELVGQYFVEVGDG